MPKEFGRNLRVSEFIKQELSVLIQREFPLGEFGMITLTMVNVSPDLKNATIFFTALNAKFSMLEMIAKLNEKAGFFRHKISCLMTAKGVPALHFKYDKSIERVQHLNDIIDSVNQPDR